MNLREYTLLGMSSQTIHRSAPTFAREKALYAQGYMHVAGVDEAGRGAWAGPVFAAAVILPHDRKARTALRGVNDSKQLTAPQREVLRERIQATALAWAVGSASSDEIDALGILPASRLAMMRAVIALPVAPDALLIDAVNLPELGLAQRAFNFADSISLSVAAASILAKTARDAAMCQLDLVSPNYGFASHKGYGTRAHAYALAVHGPCWDHRVSFAPIKQSLTNLQPATCNQ